MADAPAERLESVAGISKDDDETVREYISRLGDECDVDAEVTDAAIEYVTAWQYSSELPDDDRFQPFLEAVAESDPSNSELNTDANDQAPQSSQTNPAAPSASKPDPTHQDEGDGTSIETEPGNTTASAASATASGRDAGIASDRVTFRSGIQGKEPRKLLVRLIVIAAVSPAIGWMIGRAWVPGHQVYDQSQQLLASFLGLSGVQALELIGAFSLGVYLALLCLFILDVKKRVQGVLLALGTVISLAVVSSMGVFIPNIEFAAPLNVLGLILGFGAGIVVESAALRAVDLARSSLKRPTLQNGDVVEFRYAAWLLFGVLTLVIALSVLQVVLAGLVRVVDVVASGVFLVMLFQFVQYESETRYVTLGPERSGKSMLLLGLCLELLRHSEVHPDPNGYLQNGLERASNLQPGAERWPIPSTPHDEVRVGSFEVIAGSYFPRRLELTALDYAGQHLGRVADLFSSDAVTDEEETAAQEVASWITDADTLLFILDMERLVYPEQFQDTPVTDAEHISWGLEHYGTILNNTDPDDVIIVATKCDILIDQQFVAPPHEFPTYAEYRNVVTEFLTDRPDVEQVLRTTGESTIHPVHFVTTQHDGQYVPQLDENGNLMPVGYDHLIDQLRRRQ